MRQIPITHGLRRPRS